MYTYPYPESSSVAPLRVPVLASSTILLGQLDSTIKLDILPALGLTNFASFIQAWLFFGLASEALGREVKPHEFSEQSELGGPRFIDIRIGRWFLVELHGRWSKLRREFPPPEFIRLRRKLQNAYEDVTLALIICDTLEREAQHDYPLVLLSVHMLAFIIGDVLGFKQIKTLHSMRSTKLLMQRMANNGWCLKRLNIFTSVPIYYPCLYYLASINPPQGQRHMACTPQLCAVSTALRPPLHRTPECLCPNLQPSLSEVNRIITAGGVPLVRISLASTGGVKLEVVPYRRGCHFTAISHVWADHQFGSTQNCLPRCQVDYLYSLLKKLPRDDIWRWQNWSPWKHVPPGEIEVPVYPYELVWLDTFCIPQESIHVDLKDKAIQSMNFVYAVAARTLVLDADLQRFDAGQRPSSRYHGSTPSFFSPLNDKLLDTVAHVFASTWMGRAWTLQEGVISASCVFQLNGSQAHTKLLRPDYDHASFRLQDFLEISFIKQLLFWRTSDDTNISYYEEHVDSEVPLRDRTQDLMWRLLKQSLDIQDLSEYARGSLARKSKFVTAHKLLQSRSTTQAADLPLILVNLSGLNGNFLAKIRDTDERMRLLMYGLGKVPLELLFFKCKRLGDSQTPDRWIPKEISPQIFDDHHTLQLEEDGFKMQFDQAHAPPELYILPKGCDRRIKYLVSCPSQSGLERTLFTIKTLPSGNSEAVAANVGWCILVNRGLELRGAQFLITRMHQGSIYLRYDCPLELTKTDTSTMCQEDRSILGEIYHATALEHGIDILLEKSDIPQLLDVSRPQTPAQYSDRLVALSGILYYLLGYVEKRLSFGYLEKWCKESTCFFICYAIFKYKEREWVEESLHTIVHRAWTATYQPNWDPAGSSGWFWKIMNFEPPVPFKRMNKWLCSWILSMAIQVNSFSAAAAVCLYWLPLFPITELVGNIISSLGLKLILWFFFH